MLRQLSPDATKSKTGLNTSLLEYFRGWVEKGVILKNPTFPLQIYGIVNIKLGTVKLPTLALSELPAQPCCERFWREFKLRSLTDGQLLIKVNLSELTAFCCFFYYMVYFFKFQHVFASINKVFGWQI